MTMSIRSPERSEGSREQCPGPFARFLAALGMTAVSSCELRIRIAQLGEISCARARVEFGKHAVVEARLLELRNATVRIVDVAEDDRFCRANLRARRHNFAIANLPIVIQLGGVTRGVDTLQTIGALLHHTARAHRDIRILEQLLRR